MATMEDNAPQQEGQKEEEVPTLMNDEVSNFINSRNEANGYHEENDHNGRDDKLASMGPAPPPLPRMVLRSLPFSQSLNAVEVQHNLGMKIFMLLRHDWFHVILRRNTATSLLMLLSLWTISLFMFAVCYVGVDNMNPYEDCGLGKVGSPIKYGPAFAFSLETCTTGKLTLGHFCPVYRIVVDISKCFFDTL
jgi:hypothetical protein